MYQVRLMVPDLFLLVRITPAPDSFTILVGIITTERSGYRVGFDINILPADKEWVEANSYSGGPLDRLIQEELTDFLNDRDDGLLNDLSTL